MCGNAAVLGMTIAVIAMTIAGLVQKWWLPSLVIPSSCILLTFQLHLTLYYCALEYICDSVINVWIDGCVSMEIPDTRTEFYVNEVINN